MSELRVDNIVSEDGSAAPIYSRGMNIGAGVTLTCDGNFVVGGATSIAGTVEVGGTFKANTLTPLTGNTVTIPSGRFLSVGGGVTVASGGNLDITGGFTVGGATTITGSVDVQGSLKSNTLTPLTGDTVTIPAGRYVNVGGGVTVTNAGTFTVSGPTSFQSGAIVTGVVTFTEADLQTSLTLTGLDVGSNIKLGNAGVITATSFSGDGSNLTGIDATTIVNGSSNVTVAASGDITATRGGTTRLTVDSSGINVTGTVTCDGLTVDGNGTINGVGIIQSSTGVLVLRDNDNNDADTAQNYIEGRTADGSARYRVGDTSANGHVYISNITSNSVIFQTNNTTRCSINNQGHFLPDANNTYDLGTTSYRWRNLYTNDLNLSNEGSANDVDGTWGSWTIQEGDEDLFLINRKNGKKYKFNLTEVN
jgi:hypothetical protein